MRCYEFSNQVFVDCIIKNKEPSSEFFLFEDQIQDSFEAKKSYKIGDLVQDPSSGKAYTVRVVKPNKFLLLKEGWSV